MPRTQRTPYVILGLLGLSADEPRSGYELKKVIDSIISHVWSESHGQLYPVLKQLAKDGLVRSVATKGRGRKKTLYLLTPRGREELRRWLALPVEVGKPRDELILKLFFGTETNPGVLIGHLQTHRDQAVKSLEQCRAWDAEITANPRPESLLMRITVRAGIARAEASIRWADESIATLSTTAKAPKLAASPHKAHSS